MPPHRLLLFVLVAACSESPVPPSEISEPETYRYSLAMGPRFNANPSIQIQINGKDAGTNSVLHVPRGVKLGDPATRLEAVFETTCGREAFLLTASALNPDEAAERTKNPTSTLHWGVKAPDSMPAPAVVYLDNKWGKPTTIEIGKDSFAVGDMASKTVKVTLGTCASGRTVKIDGKVVGEVPVLEERWAGLVSTTRDMCYVQGVQVYGRPPREEEDQPTLFKQVGYVGKVPVTDYALVEPPAVVEVEEDVRVRISTVLISMPCEVWKKAGKAARKKR